MANWGARKKLFERVSFPDMSTEEDTWVDVYGKPEIVHCDSSIVYHHHRCGLWTFFKQRFRSGKNQGSRYRFQGDWKWFFSQLFLLLFSPLIVLLGGVVVKHRARLARIRREFGFFVLLGACFLYHARFFLGCLGKVWGFLFVRWTC